MSKSLGCSWLRRWLAGVAFCALAFAAASHLQAACAQEAADQALSEAAKSPDGDDGDPPSLLPTNEIWKGDLDGMRQRKQIRILVPFSKTFYFIDRGGKQFGATYEVGRAFEDWLNKQDKAKTLKTSVVFIPVPRDKLLSGLVDGTGDIAAGNITITDARAKLVQFSDPLAWGIKEILVTGPSAPPVASFDDLAGQEIFVRESSSYHEHLLALNQAREAAGKQPIIISKIDDELEDEDILEMVSAGLLPWAVVDQHKVRIWNNILPNLTLHSDLAVHEGGEIAWAMRKDSPLLLNTVNKFVDQHKLGTTFGNMLKNRYMGDKSPMKRATSEEELKKYEQLVQLFRKYCAEYDFDTLMIAAQGYQESKLDQSAKSPRGAVGIMQLLPSTAADKSIAITNIEHDPGNNIHAGVKYMRLLVDKYLDDPALDDKNRTLMAFAAYNAGPGNLRKFRKLAANSGLDPNIWFGNVEHAAAEIVGRETVQYVANIYKYYVAYRLASERAQERAKVKQDLTTTP
ncbi:MAG TPA: lytic transglycosylase F [Dongiaceae bacterium]|nr:lytic transglycosylase F [Dongiaceae bacterium]